MAADVTYEFKINLEKNQIAYANIDVDTENVILTQVGDAIWTV